MQLKSLEIKGFKSFADKTQVLLDHPVTGIVGPNGCGKSNIIDAIRWVIGEHKIKSLRSDSLEDLIFNGSKSRAGAGMAEVSLTFENTRNLLPTEFNTVTITRKFYKSGESEYRLNDVSCRLKDIHNLFLDTGVSNDSYAIIELGMVDDIIKDKDGSRRRMLEQAAGISIYKTRKKEAKQKLEATQQDIARIDDLLFEISNNLRSLESQARKAERYFQIRNDYKAVSIELAKASLEEFNEKYHGLQKQYETEQDRKLKIETEISGDEAEIESGKMKLAQIEQELSGLQRQFNDLLNRIRQLESDKKLAAQKLDHLQERERNLNAFLSNADGQLTQLKQSIQNAQLQITTESEQLSSFSAGLDGLRNSVDNIRKDFDEKRKALDTQRQALQESRNQCFEAEKKVAVADSSVANLQRSLQQLADEQSRRIAQIKDIRTEQSATEQQYQEQETRLKNLTEHQEIVKHKILESQEALEALRTQSIEENRKLDARRNEHNLLKSLVDSLEGYPDSIKFLKKNKDWNSNAPLLSDVFVVQEGYRAALENVLDNFLNYYVVQDMEEAVQAIQLLAQYKKGKANFFLMDRVAQTVPDSGDETRIPGTIRALDVVTVDVAFLPLASYLLGQVYIVEDFALLQKADLQPGDIIIEQSGKMLRGQLTLGGGSIGLFEGNKIGRAKNLERLAREIEQLNKHTGELKQQIGETQTRITGFNQELNDRAIEQAKNEMNRLNNLVINLHNKAENFEQLNLSSDRRIEETEQQLADVQSGVGNTRSELSAMHSELEKMQEAVTAAQADFTEAETAFHEISGKYNAQTLQLTRQQSKVESLSQELNFRKNQVTDLERQVKDNSGQLQDILAQIGATSGKLHFGDNELYELLQKKDTDEKILSERDRLFHEHRNAITLHEGKISRQRREKEQAEMLLNGFREKLTEMRLQVAGMKERLSVEFKVDLDTILEEARENDMTVDTLNVEAERLKKRMENMGEINPTAIEAFTEIKVRHDFIVTQKKDLEDAKDTLLATIEEVENTANAKFRETFEAVRTNFVQVFKALFTEEDAADLRLTDPEHIAESGIEIYAQPKGKRPSTLTQLSGGEKTLTSTAFLFAIYLIKPAPFCILDEVDAPLDDANVGKFTRMIRKFSDNSQFIIVTHNKQTMASVDVIYGVTMQEAGVSKLVPVDFRSLN